MGRRKTGLRVDGWVNFDKPLNMTSTEAVTRVRRLFNAQKAGHAGTLDPLASGVLPIALGEATKTVPFLMDARKGYQFTVQFGASTASCDAEGEIIARSDARPREADTRAVLARFLGEIDQTPPIYSAIKVDGERAYDLARRGEAVEMKSRRVHLYAATLMAWTPPDHATFDIFCGKGFYVRALARDLVAALGVEGHVSALARTRVGPFLRSDAIGLEKLAEIVHRGPGLDGLKPVETALDDIPALAVTGEEAFQLSQGRPILLVPRQVEALTARLAPRNPADQEASRCVLATVNGRAAALCDLRAGRLNPTRVFHLNTET